ncbi:hypothetical protein NA57DRAFT_50220 [Rhizodiscina lignyota]|uniref:Zn(2)-C6 fungal-type domain-containing protein n=1 Tax=Rhizodiscina lignyota TaxID=1504668 RepID=A0A9P4I018_9PEZI|nr:hypothetical protein NA57DRAFT_50220 [Rhizodiscina lignyota]
MEKRGPGSGTSSYGQACMQCFKAKCRCVARSDSDGCERCLRLKKQCQPSDSVRRRGLQNHESSAQIAKLEGRIDALTSMLQSIVKTTGVSADVQPILNDALSGSLNDALSAPSPHSSPFHVGGSSQPLPPSPPLYEPKTDEAEGYLDLFRTRMLPCFPFIFMPPSVNAEQLRRERPFLFRAIVAVATSSTKQKLARTEGLMHVLAKFAVLENQSNIDMLLGILTYITWSTQPFLKRAGNLSRMIMLAVSLVYDLQLAKPPLPEAHIIGKMTPGLGDTDRDARDASVQGFLEQQRAILACFVLSSIISSYFGRIDAIRWTPQMEEGLRVMNMNKQCHSDEAFAFQVRLQVFAQKINHVREQQEANSVHVTATAAATPVPAFLYLRVLQAQVQELKASLSPHLQQHGMLTAYALYVELCINEATRLASSDAPLLPTPESTSHVSGTVPGFERLECLWRSVHAVKSWLDAFYTISPATYIGFPFFFWFQLVRCIIILKHLSTFEDPAWDCQAVQNTVDMSWLLDWMAEKVEMASREAGERSDDDLFRQLSKMLRLSHGWIRAKREAAERAAEGPASVYNDRLGLATADDDGADPNQMAWMNALQSGDETWFEDFFGWPSTTL